MFRAIGSLYAQLDLGEIYSPLKGLRYRFNFGPDFRYYRNGSFQDAKSVSREVLTAPSCLIHPTSLGHWTI